MSGNGVARRLTACEPIPTNVWVELSAVHNKACMLCGQKEISEQLYGKLYQLNDIIVHYFCLVSVLPQICIYYDYYSIQVNIELYSTKICLVNK